MTKYGDDNQTLYFDWLTLNCFITHVKGFWILDPLIICVPTRSVFFLFFFYSFKQLQDGLVYMSNNNACGIIGIGTIQLETHFRSIKTSSMFLVWRNASSHYKCLESIVFTNNLYYFQGRTIVRSTIKPLKMMKN